VDANQGARRAGTEPIPYRIVVRDGLRSGSLPEGWSVLYEEDCCVIAGDVIDQSQLMGVIEWLEDRGVELVSLGPVHSSHTGPGVG
jgi:hypothetical protein